MKDKITVFVCGADKTPCSTLGCKNNADISCEFELQGRKAGQKCDRPVCSDCAGGSPVSSIRSPICTSHRRLLEKRAAV